MGKKEQNSLNSTFSRHRRRLRKKKQQHRVYRTNTQRKVEEKRFIILGIDFSS